MSDPHMWVVQDTSQVFAGQHTDDGISDWIMTDWHIYRSITYQNWAHAGTISPEDNDLGKGNTTCRASDIA